jgi:hypothetical protein
MVTGLVPRNPESPGVRIGPPNPVVRSKSRGSTSRGMTCQKSDSQQHLSDSGPPRTRMEAVLQTVRPLMDFENAPMELQVTLIAKFDTVVRNGNIHSNSRRRWQESTRPRSSHAPDRYTGAAFGSRCTRNPRADEATNHQTRNGPEQGYSQETPFPRSHNSFTSRPVRHVPSSPARNHSTLKRLPRDGISIPTEGR